MIVKQAKLLCYTFFYIFDHFFLLLVIEKKNKKIKNLHKTLFL